MPRYDSGKRLPDYHIHTTLCKHAEGSAADYVSRAYGMGLPEICFTDHCPTPDAYDKAHRMAMDEFPQYDRTVRSGVFGEEPRVLFGIEADYYEGCEVHLRSWLQGQGFDLVLGSVHFIGNWGFDDPEQKGRWRSVDVKTAWRDYFLLVRRLAESRLFDAVAHLDLPKKFGHRLPDKDMIEIASPVLDSIACAGMGIEINTGGLRRPVKEIYPSGLLLSLAREREIPICFGSDAHAPEEVGYGFDHALDLAREAGYRESFLIKDRKKRLVPLP